MQGIFTERPSLHNQNHNRNSTVVLLSLVSDSPQAPVAQLSKWLELFAASARYSFEMGGTLGSSVARVTLAAIPQLGLKSTFSFADAGSPPEKFPS